MDGDAPRSWTQHLRMLPGGESGAGGAVATVLALYMLLLMPGCVAAAAFNRQLDAVGGPFAFFSVANAFPCTVIATWTAFRVARTKPVGQEEAAVDLVSRRVYYGDEMPRVPTSAVVLPLRPRQVTAAAPGGRRITALFRVNGDPEDLLALAEELRWRGPDLEAYVAEAVAAAAKDGPLDVATLRDLLGDLLLPFGVVVTRLEVS